MSVPVMRHTSTKLSFAIVIIKLPDRTSDPQNDLSSWCNQLHSTYQFHRRPLDSPEVIRLIRYSLEGLAVGFRKKLFNAAEAGCAADLQGATNSEVVQRQS